VSDARQQGHVLAPAKLAQHLRVGPQPAARPSVERRKRDVSSHLVHEHQAFRVHPSGEEQPPCGPQEFVALTRTQRPSFGLKPIRLKSLERVDSLTETPATPSRKRHLSLSVRAGLFSTSASSTYGAENANERRYGFRAMLMPENSLLEVVAG
jgi:hypothetical protein